MDTILSIIFGVIGVVILGAAIGIAIYKRKKNLMADLHPRKDKTS